MIITHTLKISIFLLGKNVRFQSILPAHLQSTVSEQERTCAYYQTVDLCRGFCYSFHTPVPNSVQTNYTVGEAIPYRHLQCSVRLLKYFEVFIESCDFSVRKDPRDQS